MQPTPYPDIKKLLYDLLSAVQVVLGKHFTGLYLYGSLASGDFNPQTSDIDFLVLTNGEIPTELIPELEAMHARLASCGSKWAGKLEGAYLPTHAIRRHDPTDNKKRPCLNEGRFYLAALGSDWVIQRHLIRESEAVITGPDPQTIIDPVTENELRLAVAVVLHDWWAPMLEEPERLRGSEYQAYAILSMCRALFTMKHGTIASKTVSARWAQEILSPEQAMMIEEAITWRPGKQMDRYKKTINFIRYTIKRSQGFERML